MINLYGVPLYKLEQMMIEEGQSKFRAKQLYTWIYEKEEIDFDNMSDISKSFRDVLKQKYCLIKPTIYTKQLASDGTIKLLVEMSDGSKVETVLMRYNYGNVVCVTSQVGCNMGCSFCASGLLKKQRNLEAHEMVGQILVMNDLLKEENFSKAYIILNTAGTLQEIGSGVLENDINGILLRLDPVEKAIETVNSEIGKLNTLIGTPKTDEVLSSGIFAELDKKANADDVYTKDETDLKIGTAVAEASHLKRKEVQSTNEIDVDAADADQYIYMVPSGLLDDDNKYYEYMVIEVEIVDNEGVATKIKKVEQVGSWSVDLSVYAKAEDLLKETERAKEAEKANADDIKNLKQKDIDTDLALADKVDKVFYTVVNEDGSTSQVEGTLLTPEEKEKLAALSFGENGNIGISGTVSVDNVQGLGTWITNNSNKYIQNLTESNLSQTTKDKLNFITSVDPNRFTVVNNQLGFVPVTTSDIADFTTFSTKINNLETDVGDLIKVVGNDTTGLTAVNGKISNLEKLFDNYVTINNFNKVVGDLDTLLESNTTIMTQIDDLNNRLIWQDLN